MKKPSLFGIKHSNRDFTSKGSWGKNQFNSSFPAALTAFIHSKGLNCKYLVLCLFVSAAGVAVWFSPARLPAPYMYVLHSQPRRPGRLFVT